VRYTFGEKLKILRIKKSLTQKELALKTGIPFYTIVALENHRTKIPLITTVKTFANYFNLSIDEFIKNVRWED
jgi:transcriptional regulator with XRE-family HTH domain